MSPRDKAADLTLRETAAALGLSVGTVRAHIRAGRLHATQVVAKHGPEYRLRPAVWRCRTYRPGLGPRPGCWRWAMR